MRLDSAEDALMYVEMLFVITYAANIKFFQQQSHLIYHIHSL